MYINNVAFMKFYYLWIKLIFISIFLSILICDAERTKLFCLMKYSIVKRIMYVSYSTTITRYYNMNQNQTFSDSHINSQS